MGMAPSSAVSFCNSWIGNVLYLVTSNNWWIVLLGLINNGIDKTGNVGSSFKRTNDFLIGLRYIKRLRDTYYINITTRGHIHYTRDVTCIEQSIPFTNCYFNKSSHS